MSKLSYEIRMVTVFWFAWAFVALDRLVIMYLFPVIIPALGLNYGQAGFLVSLTGLFFAASCLFLGAASDKYGRRKVIIPSVIFFSLLSWLTGLGKNFGQLAVVRGLLGFTEGGYYPSAVATIAEEATPTRRGLLLGIHQSAYAVAGMLLGPIYAVKVAAWLGWQWVFWLTLPAGIIVALLVGFLVKEPASTLNRIKARREDSAESANEKVKYLELFRHKNIVISTIVSICIMAWLYTLLAFTSSFLTTGRGFSMEEMGYIMSAFGVGGALGFVGIMGLSDYFGRKKIFIIAAFLCGIVTLLFTMVSGGVLLTVLLLVAMGFLGMGLFSLSIAAIPAESVPITLAGAAVGLVTAAGEIIGTGIMPWLAGSLADEFGIKITIILAGSAVIISGAVGFLFMETAPRLVGPKLAKVSAYSSVENQKLSE